MELDWFQGVFWALIGFGCLILIPLTYIRSESATGGAGGAFRKLSYIGFALTFCSSAALLLPLLWFKIWILLFVTVLAVLFTLTRFLSLSGKRDKAENALALWIGIGVLSPPVLALAHILWITECYDEKSQASHIFVMLLVTILLNRLGVFCEFEWDGRRTWDARSSPFNRYFQVSRATHIQSVESETEVQSEITYEQWLNEERKNLKSPPESERPNTRS